MKKVKLKQVFQNLSKPSQVLFLTALGFYCLYAILFILGMLMVNGLIPSILSFGYFYFKFAVAALTFITSFIYLCRSVFLFKKEGLFFIPYAIMGTVFGFVLFSMEIIGYFASNRFTFR